jgi:hypothetical protein
MNDKSEKPELVVAESTASPASSRRDVVLLRGDFDPDPQVVRRLARAEASERKVPKR